jgi:hypothetical protein
MDYKEFFITIGIMFLVTILYFVIKRFISWTIDDDEKYYTKQGSHIKNKKHTKNRKQLAYDKLIGGYAIVMFVLVLYVVKIIISAYQI